MVPSMHEVTHILSAIEQGDAHAAEQLLPLVYDELRQLAAQKLAQEPRARRSRRPPWSTTPTCGWSMSRRPSTGTAEAISLPPPPRRCGGS
jgi:hypothetical protein